MGHPKESLKTHMGGKRTQKKAYGMQRTAIRKVSPKERKRKAELKGKREKVLNAMHERWGFEFCMVQQIGKWPDTIECEGRLDLAHVKPASRHTQDRDDMTNLGILCRAHHNYFTRTPGLYDVEFRTEEMKKFMAELGSAKQSC